MKIVAILAVLLFSLSVAFADSIDPFDVVVQQVGGDIQLLPDGNPLIYSSSPPFSGLTIGVPSFTPVLLSEYTITVDVTLGTQLFPFTTELDCVPPGPCGFFVGSAYPFFSSPVNGMVTVAINDRSETFHFRYQTLPTSAVPEPSTLLLFATGALSLVGVIRKKECGA